MRRLLVGLCWAFVRLPGGFLPVDDQGFITTDVQTPSESSYARTEAAVEKVEKYLAQRAGVDNVTFLTGFSFAGQGMNTAQAFISLKDWSERSDKDSAAAIVADINRDLASIRDAKISALQPPPIDNLGNSSGFSFRLQDRGQKGFAALNAAADQLIAEANAGDDPAESLCRGSAAGAADQPHDRSRKGRRIRRHLRGHQQYDLDQSRLQLRQRFSQPRPDAARDRAGRSRQPDERRRNSQLQRQEQPRPAGAVLRFRLGRMVEGPDADRGLQLLSGGAHQRRGQARLYLRRRHRRDGTARRQTAARLRLRLDRAVAAGKAVGLAGAIAARPVGAGGVPVSGRAL